MATEETKETKETKTPAAGEGGGEQPQKPAKTPPAGEQTTKTDEKPAAKAKTEPTGGGEGAQPKRASLKDDDDEIPEDAELLELSQSGLKARLRRHTKKELKARFGTDNPEEISERLKKLEKLEAQEEERERAKLSEKERWEKEKSDLLKRAETAEGRLAAVYDERIISKEEERVVRLAKEAGMDPDYIEDQFPKLAKYLNENFSAKELKKLKDGPIKKWFEERVKAKPKLAASDGGGEGAESQTQPKPKVGLTNGAAGGRQPPPKDGAEVATEKTFKPGKANSMSRGEARDAMAKMGIRY